MTARTRRKAGDTTDSIILALPYDRPNTTMKQWPLDTYCDGEYRDPANRRFHAQPVACPQCGPHYLLKDEDSKVEGDGAAIRRAVELFRDGKIVAVKGLGGYHLAGAAMEPRIPATVDDLDRLISPRVVAPAHCTGWRAANALAERFSPGRFAPSVVGSSYALTAPPKAPGSSA